MTKFMKFKNLNPITPNSVEIAIKIGIFQSIFTLFLQDYLGIDLHVDYKYILIFIVIFFINIFCTWNKKKMGVLNLY